MFRSPQNGSTLILWEEIFLSTPPCLQINCLLSYVCLANYAFGLQEESQAKQWRTRKTVQYFA